MKYICGLMAFYLFGVSSIFAQTHVVCNGIQLQKKFSIFGEIHGTKEAPEKIAYFVKNEVACGERVLVVLEHPESDVEELISGVRNISPDADVFDSVSNSRLFGSGRGSAGDGRASVAMKTLVIAILSLQKLNSNIDLVGVLPSTPNAGHAIHSRAKKFQATKVIALFGNNHARSTSTAEFYTTSFTQRLVKEVGEGAVQSILLLFSKGFAWACFGGSTGCGVQQIGGFQNSKIEAGEMQIFSKIDDMRIFANLVKLNPYLEFFDAALIIRNPTASYPAR